MFTNRWIRGIDDISDVLSIRTKVLNNKSDFKDVLDEQAWHCIIIWEGKDVATGRIYPNAGFWHIDKRYVLPDYQGKGIGDLLFRVLVDRAIRFDTADVCIEVDAKHYDYFAAFGFSPVASEEKLRMQLKREDVVFPSSCGGD